MTLTHVCWGGQYNGGKVQQPRARNSHLSASSHRFTLVQAVKKRAPSHSQVCFGPLLMGVPSVEVDGGGAQKVFQVVSHGCVHTEARMGSVP